MADWRSTLESFAESLPRAVQQQRWLIEIGLIVLATLVAAWLIRIVLERLQRRAARTANLYDDALLDAARLPATWIVAILGLCEAAQRAGAHWDAPLFSVIEPIRTLGVIVPITHFGVRFVRVVEARLVSPDYRAQPMDLTTASAIGKLLRAAVLIAGLLSVLQSLGFSISGVLAFGGVGGVAIGFAARDLLANFFGALMLYTDRQFSVGDWIRSPDRTIEGVVEEIGWRITRIRTFETRPLYVPNAAFTNLAVENPSRMRRRRIYETIGVRYADAGAVRGIVEDVRAMLEAHSAIADDETLMVRFNAFGGSSLDFFIYTFTKTVVWVEYHRVKEEVLLRVSDIIASHGAEVAFPTQTLYFASQEAETSAAARGDHEPASGRLARRSRDADAGTAGPS